MECRRHSRAPVLLRPGEGGLRRADSYPAEGIPLLPAAAER